VGDKGAYPERVGGSNPLGGTKKQIYGYTNYEKSYEKNNKKYGAGQKTGETR